MQSEWIASVVITRERIYRWARWAGGNNLSAKRVDLEKRVDPMLGFVWIFQLWPLDRVNQWLTFKVILIILWNGIGMWRDLVDFISLNNIKYYECRCSTARFLSPSRSSGIYVLPFFFLRELCSSFCEHAGHLASRCTCHARKWRYQCISEFCTSMAPSTTTQYFFSSMARE